MQISILTLFPQFFTSIFDFSMMKRAQDKNIVAINYINIRDFAQDKYQTVDDKPYGGGAGMVLKVDVVDKALTMAKKAFGHLTAHTILLDPKGDTFTQAKAHALSTKEHIIYICGHYEGVDHRVNELVDESISIGPYILTGGEIATAVITESVVRLIPGVLGNETSTQTESFSDGYLEYPQYTRPPEYHGMKVPDVLLKGNHEHINTWRKQMSKKISSR